ncbi:MAG TPA: DUF3592 domain-containing protein [Roseiflexaceae bacterium]|nr:DUF3592 domain-containing protein [Roseiflexaceae bacterium]
MRTTNLTRRSPLSDNTFLIHAGNQHFISGVSGRIHGPNEKALLVGCFATIALIVTLFGALLNWANHQHWAEQGVETHGVILTVEAGSRSGLRYTYAYTATTRSGPLTATGSKVVNPALLGSPQRGDPVTVRYLPYAPRNSTVGWRADGWGLTRELLILAALLTLAGPLLALLAWRRLRLLAREGWLVAAEILHTHFQHNNGVLVLDYCFAAPGGHLLRRRYTCQRGGACGELTVPDWLLSTPKHQPPQDWLGQPIALPQAGQSVAVLYVSEKLYQLL